jgi:hypothetical protein
VAIVAVRTYIDPGVLICALRGSDRESAAALSFLYDPLREYVTSDYVRIELIPKCVFHKNDVERQFYEKFFRSSTMRVPSSDELLAFAIEEGGRTGISGIDAIHVACALVAEAEELVTTEKATKPIHNARGIRVISVRS